MDRSIILKAIDDAKRVVATCPTWKRKSDCVGRSMNGEFCGIDYNEEARRLLDAAKEQEMREAATKASDCLTAADALALSRRIEKIESDIHKIENVLEKVVALLERIVPDRSKV